MQNLARFRTTSKFGGEYHRNGCRYSKSDSHSVYGDSSCVRRNKSGEVRSSDLGDLDVKSYPPKAQFSEDRISAPKGCCAPKFLHVLENDQVLPAHPPPGTAAPLKIWEGKKRPKFSMLYDNFRVWPQISLNWIKISTSGKRRYQIRLIPRWTKKIV